LCWYKSRKILVELSSKPFNSREVSHCLMSSGKEINFLAVKCDRKLALKRDLRCKKQNPGRQIQVCRTQNSCAWIAQSV
jgi:hypothetical protein